MSEDNINFEYITQYLHKTLPKNQGILAELENYAEENHVPIVHPEVGKLILVLAKMNNPANILEIGTAIGYSSILLSGALQLGGKILTIEASAAK